MSTALGLDECVDDLVIDEAYITGGDDDPQIVSRGSLLQSLVDNITMRGYAKDDILKEIDATQTVSKSIDGSRQESTLAKGRQISGLNDLKVIEPPYSPELLKIFAQSDETNYRCIAAKAQDAVGRSWTLEIEKTQATTPEQYDAEDAVNPARLEQATIQISEATTFLRNCNHIFGIEGVLLKAAMDLESVGWAAIEVIRSADMKVAKLDYAPADRFKVLEGWGGFIELREGGKKVYYQPFGQKVLSKKRANTITTETFPYSPELDGELTPVNATFNMIDWETGKSTNDFMRSASEIIWIVKHHPSTLYYGITDTIPILPKILINMNINQYALQFFEHNTVPRYVVVIKGAKLDAQVKDTILKYFQTEVKGRAHKTLVMPLPTGRGEVSVTFQKLDADNQDGWFRESYKDNADSIRIAQGVTAAIVGQSENASLGSGKGLSQAEIYKDRVAVPNQQRWAAILKSILSVGRGLSLVCVVFDELDTRDHESKMRVYTGWFDRGIVSINQVRAACSLGAPISGGDRPFIKVGNSILFVDDLKELKSGPVGAPSAGGDTRSNIPVKPGAGNTAISVVTRGAQT